MSLATPEQSEKLFVTRRVLAAPRALVWKAFSEADHLLKWWGPKGCTMLGGALDFRPGGRFHYGMRGPDGSEMWGRFVYEEIVEPERIVFVNSFSDPEGGLQRAFFSSDWPLEVRNTLSLVEENGMTTLTLRGGPIRATEAERAFFDSMHESMDNGFKGTWDQLEAHLAELQAQA
jgi:uncharacterized protein YndB with AHSA1/START domain